MEGVAGGVLGSAGAAGELVRAGSSWGTEGHSGLLRALSCTGNSSRNLPSQSLHLLQALGQGLMDEPGLNRSWLEEKPHLEVPSCAELLRVWGARVPGALGLCSTHTVPRRRSSTSHTAPGIPSATADPSPCAVTARLAAPCAHMGHGPDKT